MSIERRAKVDFTSSTSLSTFRRHVTARALLGKHPGRSVPLAALASIIQGLKLSAAIGISCGESHLLLWAISAFLKLGLPISRNHTPTRPCPDFLLLRTCRMHGIASCTLQVSSCSSVHLPLVAQVSCRPLMCCPPAIDPR